MHILYEEDRIIDNGLRTPKNDVMNDADGYDGMILNRWLADMASKGKWIDWERMV